MWPFISGLLFAQTVSNIAGIFNGPRQRLVGILAWFGISLALQRYTTGFGSSANAVAGALLLLLMFLVTCRPNLNRFVHMLSGGLQLYVLLKAAFAAFWLLRALQNAVPFDAIWPHILRTAGYASAVLLVNWRFAFDRFRQQQDQSERPLYEQANGINPFGPAEVAGADGTAVLDPDLPSSHAPKTPELGVRQ